ncbi:MAG TPA: hypothetical protein VJB35_00605 [Candidatus Nanoarchaeia archaeon]|nr:hypothetical protein [Candidatus Nanoarchaeia archaeon]
MDLNFGHEREITQEIGKGLESSFKEAKKIDYQIAKSLNNDFGLMGYIGQIPLVGKVVTKVRAVKPLKSLESELRTSLNNSLVSLVKVGKKVQTEKERIKDLNVVYETAIKDEWGPKEFMNFIESNSDLNLVVSLDGEQFDMKYLFGEVDLHLSPERMQEKQQEYLDWFKQHINLSEQYLDSMEALCFVGCEWIGGMTRSYFDLTQLRGGMEEIQKTLNNLGRGGNASISSQKALRKYGTAYINGMKSLVNGYKKMCALKDNGSDEFRIAIGELKSELDKPNQYVELDNSKKNLQKRLTVNPNSKEN